MARQIEQWPIGRLRPNPKNPRTHSKRQLEQLRSCISYVGFINPILANSAGQVVAGHGRVTAAKQLGMTEVPVIVIDDLSPSQIRAYAIADNKIAENAGWDKELLKLELKELAECTELDLRITGFETAELDVLLLDPDEDPADAIAPASIDGPAVSRVGDLWEIGEHRLICGSAIEPEVYSRLLKGEPAQQIFTDPPWNVPINGHVSGSGKHAEFVMASGEMTSSQFQAFLEQSFQLMASNSADGALHYVCIDWRHLPEALGASKACYSEIKNLCVWNKNNAGMGSFYRSQHELVLVLKRGAAPHINNIELGKHGRYRTNVWSYPGLSAFGGGRDEQLAMHPTVKPIQLVADAIADGSRRGGAILDAFAGSGTTLLAAHKIGRRGFGIELSPRYVDVAVNRFMTRYGLTARLAGTSLSFEETKKEREFNA